MECRKTRNVNVNNDDVAYNVLYILLISCFCQLNSIKIIDTKSAISASDVNCAIAYINFHNSMESQDFQSQQIFLPSRLIGGSGSRVQGNKTAGH